MISRTLFSPEHTIYRDQVHRFIQREIMPHHVKWEKDQIVPRSLWIAAGEAGLLCPAIPEEWGGGGGDRLNSVIVAEELARAGASGPGFTVHSEIVAPYILAYGTDEQRRRYLPLMAKGELIGAIAMSEPGAGSDLAKHSHNRKEMRQRLCAQRLENLHHQRKERRCRHRRCED